MGHPVYCRGGPCGYRRGGKQKSRQINGLINEWYLEDLSNNVRAVLDHKRREGLFIGSFALYGYCKAPDAKGKLVIDPEAAEVVRRIFALALSGMGAHKIAQILNKEGIPSPTAYKQLHGAQYHAAMKKRIIRCGAARLFIRCSIIRRTSEIWCRGGTKRWAINPKDGLAAKVPVDRCRKYPRAYHRP